MNNYVGTFLHLGQVNVSVDFRMLVGGGGTTFGHAILEHVFALLHHEWLDLGLETALHNSMLCNPLARSLEHKLSCTQILDAGNTEDLRELKAMPTTLWPRVSKSGLF